MDDSGKHNTITPSIRKIDDEYNMYLILRNNRCDEKYPEGIFHAHPEYHHIKKEGIGIIEAMGLFILPARLVRQENEIKDVLLNNLDDKEILEKYADLADFLPMINELKKKYNPKTIDNDINKYIMSDSIIAKASMMNEDNYTLNLDSKKYRNDKNPTLQYNDKHAKILMWLSLIYSVL